MKKTLLLLSAGYWFSAYTLGLLLHPYKTMREMVRLKIYTPLTLVPLVMWLMGWAIGMLGLRFGGAILTLVGIKPTPAGLVYGLGFGFWWGSWFLGLWQALLIYLFIRFCTSFWRE